MLTLQWVGNSSSFYYYYQSYYCCSTAELNDELKIITKEKWNRPGRLGLTCLSGWWMSTGGSGLSLQICLWKPSRRGRCSRTRAPRTSPPLCLKTSWHCSISRKPRSESSFTYKACQQKNEIQSTSAEHCLRILALEVQSWCFQLKYSAVGMDSSLNKSHAVMWL